jgi:hypothetical protein
MHLRFDGSIKALEISRSVLDVKRLDFTPQLTRSFQNGHRQHSDFVLSAMNVNPDV